MVLTLLIGPPILSGMLYLISHTGDHFYIYVFLFVTVVMLVMATIYPIWIAPLFNKFTPLEDGSLKDQVFALAKSINYPLDKLFVVDGSKHSSHSNAYLVGIFVSINFFNILLVLSFFIFIYFYFIIILSKMDHWKTRFTHSLKVYY